MNVSVSLHILNYFLLNYCNPLLHHALPLDNKLIFFILQAPDLFKLKNMVNNAWIVFNKPIKWSISDYILEVIFFLSFFLYTRMHVFALKHCDMKYDSHFFINVNFILKQLELNKLAVHYRELLKCLFSSNIVWQWCRHEWYWYDALNADAIENMRVM